MAEGKRTPPQSSDRPNKISLLLISVFKKQAKRTAAYHAPTKLAG